MLVPPPRALPNISVRAVVGHAGRDSQEHHAQLHSEVEWKVGPLAKLHMDFACQERLRRPMDDDTAELTTRLCTHIGVIMEDADVTELTIGAASEDIGWKLLPSLI